MKLINVMLVVSTICLAHPVEGFADINDASNPTVKSEVHDTTLLKDSSELQKLKPKKVKAKKMPKTMKTKGESSISP